MSILSDYIKNQTKQEFFCEFTPNQQKEYISFDLDGTLAEYHGFDPKNPNPGKPIPKMMDVLRKHLENGDRVKIFTARATDPKSIPYIKQWLKNNNLPDLEITNVKDVWCKMMYDDRAVQVRKNSGEILGDPSIISEIFQ
jgi:hypothetical protein